MAEQHEASEAGALEEEPSPSGQTQDSINPNASEQSALIDKLRGINSTINR